MVDYIIYVCILFPIVMLAMSIIYGIKLRLKFKKLINSITKNNYQLSEQTKYLEDLETYFFKSNHYLNTNTIGNICVCGKNKDNEKDAICYSCYKEIIDNPELYKSVEDFVEIKIKAHLKEILYNDQSISNKNKDKIYNNVINKQGD